MFFSLGSGKVFLGKEMDNFLVQNYNFLIRGKGFFFFWIGKWEKKYCNFTRPNSKQEKVKFFQFTFSPFDLKKNQAEKSVMLTNEYYFNGYSNLLM